MGRSRDEEYVAKTLGFSNTIRARLLLQQNEYDCDKAIRSWQAMASTLPSPPPIPPKYNNTTALSQQSPENGSESEQDAHETGTPEPDVSATSLGHDTTEWDFILPQIPAPEALINGDRDGSLDFCLDLIGAIQGGESFERVRSYLAFYDTKTTQAHINGQVASFPESWTMVTNTNPPPTIRSFGARSFALVKKTRGNIVSLHHQSEAPSAKGHYTKYIPVRDTRPYCNGW